MNNKYHSTSQFRNVAKHIKQMAQYVGYDEVNKAVIVNRDAEIPTLDYVGTVKLHGTNASIVLEESGEVSLHSKSKLLGKFLPKGRGVVRYSDNSGFFYEMSLKENAIVGLLLEAVELCKRLHGEVVYPIKISGEWCGKGIQKGVSISFLPNKSLFVFGVKFGDKGWCPVLETLPVQANHADIYNISQFPVKKISIDFSDPAMSQNALVEATLEIEKCCPVGKTLGVTESLIGEGLVWTPTSNIVADTGTWFKTKGEKHSVSNTKSVVPVDMEKVANVVEFVSYAVSENRLKQGLEEVGLDQKYFNQFIGWVSKDIHKEESDVLKENNLTMKDVGSKVAEKARKFYIQELNKL
jgi:hypothetical protein